MARDTSRRHFLSRFGVAVVGAGALPLLLSDDDYTRRQTIVRPAHPPLRQAVTRSIR